MAFHSPTGFDDCQRSKVIIILSSDLLAVRDFAKRFVRPSALLINIVCRFLKETYSVCHHHYNCVENESRLRITPLKKFPSRSKPVDEDGT